MMVFVIVLPVFIAILLGGVLTRCGFLRRDLISELNRLTYYVGLPAYLFSSVASASFGGGRVVLLNGVMVGATFLALTLGYVLGRARGIGVESFGSFLHASIRGNLMYIGLPVVLLAIEAHAGADAGMQRQVALLAMAPLVVITNALGVLLLLVGHERPGLPMVKSILVQLVTNPILLASLAGVVVAISGTSLPRWLMQSVAVVGQMALPLALLCIGGTLVTIPLQGKRTNAALASIVKVAVTPAIGYFLARWADLGLEETRTVLLFLAAPTAAASFTLAGKLGGDEALAATSVVVSTGLSVVSLSAVLLLV